MSYEGNKGGGRGGANRRNGQQGENRNRKSNYSSRNDAEGQSSPRGNKQGGRRSFKDENGPRREEKSDWSKERRSAFPKPPAYNNGAIRRENNPVQVAEENEGPMIIFGRNSVREAIKSGRSIDKVFVLDTGKEDGSLREIVRMIKENNIVMIPASRNKLDMMSLPHGYGGKPANHQGIIAQMPEMEYVEIEDILQDAKDKGEKPFLLILDSISDPHNLGAILRTAECAGVHGVIIPKRRAASLTASAVKASAGAALYVKVARVPNLSAAAEKLKQSGVWIAGAEAGEARMEDVRLDGPLALVIGSEGEGISKGLKDHCDTLVSIPMFGKINSLNASNAAAILIYEKLRQDHR